MRTSVTLQPALAQTVCASDRGYREQRPQEASRPNLIHTVLLVEGRDDVYEQLAAVLEASGLAVARSRSATEAHQELCRHPVDLVISNVDLPDESGWLLASKTSMTNAKSRVWLYAPRESPAHDKFAQFVGAERIYHYGGDPHGLATELCARCRDASPFLEFQNSQRGER